MSTNAWNVSCPAMTGTNPSSSSQFTYDAGTRTEVLRLQTSYDSFTPAAGTRYTIFQMHFDHSRSAIGPTTPDHSVCGGIEYCEELLFDFAKVLTPDGQSISLPGCDPYTQYCGNASWNEGCSPDDVGPLLCGDFVRAQSSTWGRVKSLYR